jgi:hypothetical protein
MKEYPLTLALSHGVEREEKEEKILRKPLTLPSPAEWRGEKEDEKILTSSHPDTLSLVERVEKGREGNKKEFT